MKLTEKAYYFDKGYYSIAVTELYNCFILGARRYNT